MSVILHACILIISASLLLGCSLVWGVDPKERPTTEVSLCANGLDDDLDRLADCEDPDCAWVTHCLAESPQPPYTTINCTFSQDTATDNFDRDSVSRRGGLCEGVLNQTSFGGNNLICGPRVGQRALPTTYQLDHWNVLAKGYCGNIESRILDADSCNETGPRLRDCDAPILVCRNRTECQDFLVFLNGDRDSTGEDFSGIVSRDIGLFMERTDFFSIETSIHLLTTQMLASGDDERVLSCGDSNSCSDACQMFVEFGPKTYGFGHAAVRLRLKLNPDNQLEIDYQIVGTDDVSGFGRCGSQTLMGESSNFRMALKGPYFKSGSMGEIQPRLTVSLSESETESVLCEIPWSATSAVDGPIEYELKYLRSGAFTRGRLLLDGVAVQRRTMDAALRMVCGASDIGIFQGGRTVCQPPAGPISQVLTAQTAAESNRRFAMTKTESGSSIRLYEEKEHVLFELGEVELGTREIDSVELLAFESMETSDTDIHLRVWITNAAADVFIHDIFLETQDDGSERIRSDALRQQSSAAASILSRWMPFPGDIYKRQVEESDRYWYLAISDESVVLASSVDGVSNWRIVHESEALRQQLGSLERLQNQQILHVSVQPVPDLHHETDSSVALILLASRSSDNRVTSELNFHMLTLHRDAESAGISFNYHEELRIDPIQFSTTDEDLDVPMPERSACLEPSCLRFRGAAAMELEPKSGVLTVYVPSRIDESFPPKRSPAPSSCGLGSRTDRFLPSDKVWRRLFLRLDRVGDVAASN